MDEKEFEDICYICRRPESKAGRMFHLPNNICICDDCMHKTMDAVSQFDYQQMMNNPMFMNMLNNPFNPYGDPTKSNGTSGQKSAGGGNEKATQKQLMQKQLMHRMETTHPTTLPLTFWRHLMRTTIPRMTPTNPRATEEASRTSALSILRIS